MCTVTFIPLKDTIIITSSRDEKYSRKQALPPQEYYFNGGAIIYPKGVHSKLSQEKNE